MCHVAVCKLAKTGGVVTIIGSTITRAMIGQRFVDCQKIIATRHQSDPHAILILHRFDL